MAGGDDYRIKAAELQALAEREISESGRAEYMQLVKSYLLLAELAERNLTTDIVYETPPNGGGHSSAVNDAFDPPSSKGGDSGVNA